MMKQICARFADLRLAVALGGAVVSLSLCPSGSALAASATEIDAGVNDAIVRFEKEISKSFLASSKGVLVFPRVIQGGLIVGAEYGEGALRIDGKTVDYYSIAAASFGLQAGGQVKTVYVVFLDDEALKQFRQSEGWKAGADGSIVLGTLGTEGLVDSMMLNKPIIGFVLDQKGLIADMSYEGSKYTKLDR